MKTSYYQYKKQIFTAIVILLLNIAAFAQCTLSISGTTTICSGSFTTLTAFGATTYSWSPGGFTTSAITVAPTTTTIYTVTGDGGACSASTTVTVLPSPTANLSSQTNVLCNGSATGAATVVGTGGTPAYTYSWSPSGGNAATASGLAAGSYTCTVADANGCSSTKAVNITQPASAISLSISSQIPVLCNGSATGSVTISASGGTGTYSYSWSPSGGNAATASSLVAGSYTCTVTDANGCTQTQAVIITQPASPLSLSISSQTNVLCSGNNSGSCTISASGGTPGYTYSWVPSGGNGPMASGLTAGSYTCTVTDANGCTETQNVTINEPIFPTAVSAGSDTMLCAYPINNYQLQAVAISQNGNSTFSWSPITGLSNPTIANPYVNNVHNQQYTVTMTDAAGCIVYDTVVVTVHNSITKTVYLCSNTLTLDVGAAGGMNYTWTPTGDTTNSILADTAGVFSCVANYAGGCTTNSQFTVIDSCITYSNVWPGDCNYDLIANNNDVLNIGLAYNAIGSIRPSATNGWYGQPMSDWSQNFSTGINYKHADCNGDGTVDSTDSQVISLNYNYTHSPFLIANSSEARNTPDFFLVATTDTIGTQATASFDIMLGNTASPIDSIYGVAFSIGYDTSLTAQSPVITYNNSWFGNPGTNMFSFNKAFDANGYVDLAVTRIDHMNVSGSGKIGSCSIVTTDNLSGFRATAVLNLKLTNVKAVTKSGIEINLIAAGDSIVVKQDVTTGVSNIDMQSAIHVFPNPSSGLVNITSSYKNIEQITIYNTLGEMVYMEQKPTVSTSLDLHSLPNGMYVVKVKTDKGVANKRITVFR